MSLTTPKMPYKVKVMLTEVGVDTLVTGRIGFRSKTG